METFMAVIMAIITYITSLFTAIPAFIENIKSKPDLSWLITASKTVERSYDEYYDFYQKNYDYHRENNLKAENLKDVTEEYQALLDSNLEIAKQWKQVPIQGQINFYNAVNDGGMWDYKLTKNHQDIAADWGLGVNESFSVYGVVMDWEILGNINFAFTGGAVGFTPTTIQTGGGLVAVKHGGVKWETLPYYFDDEDDHAWISFGLSLYSFVDEAYLEQASTIDNLLDIADPRIIGISIKLYEEINKANA